MKRYFSIVFVCVFLFSPTGYADDITIPYKTGDGMDGIYTGEVLDGLPNGHGKFVWRSFPSNVQRYRTEYVGEWKNGSQVGHGATTYITLDNQDQPLSTAKHVGLYKDGVKHGQGTFNYSDGSKTIGEFQNDGVFSGVVYDKEGNVVLTIVLFRRGVYVGEEVDGIPNGYGTFVAPGADDGFEYVGEFKDGVYHGQGTHTNLNGEKYVGEFKDGLRHGRGTLTYPSGEKYVGEFKGGFFHDKGTWTHPSGQKYVGEFKAGFYHGQGTYTFPNGQKYVGGYKADKKHGQGTYTFPSGQKYVGEFKGGLYHGKGTYTFPNGQKYVGEYKEDKKHGQGTYTYSSGDKYVGQWKDGKKHGQGIYTFPSGQKYVGEYKNDLIHGQGTTTLADGSSYVGEYKEGEHDGQGTLTYADGSQYVGQWKDGKKHGQGGHTWPNGHKESGEYKDGRFWNGVRESTDDKLCLFSGVFKEGKRKGGATVTCAVTYEDGGKYDGEMRAGYRNGHGVHIYPNGTKYVGGWKLDLPHGYGSFKFASGETYVGDVYDGVPHGHGTYTYTDGSQYVGEWKEFAQHGYGVLTQADGRVFSGEWTEGKYCPKCKRDWDNAHAAGQRGDYREVIRLLLTYAESGDMFAQGMVGVSYYNLGRQFEASKWYLKAAEQGHPLAQYNLGLMYGRGEGVELNHTVAIKLLEQALLQKLGMAAKALSAIYYEGRGVPRDRSVAYAYQSIAAALGVEQAKYLFDLDDEYNRVLGKSFYPDYAVAQGQVIAQEIWAKIEAYGFDRSGAGPDGSTEETISTGSGFFINDLGFVVTNSHVVNGCREIYVILDDKKANSYIVINDVKNDLAVLKTGVEPASIAYFRSGRGIRAGEDVLAFGYPLQNVLSDELKGTKGMVNALSGMNNDTRMMQISAPVQPGNSGGPLLDQAGNIVGVVTAKMDAIVMAQLTDDIAQNVNFALKASLVRDMLEVKEIDYETASSKEERNTADIFEQANKFTVLVECLH